MVQAKSTEFVLPAVVGGAAFVEGPLVGGLIMIPLSEIQLPFQILKLPP